LLFVHLFYYVWLLLFELFFVHLYQWKKFHVATLDVMCWMEEQVVLLYLIHFVKWGDFSSLGYV
jgi:hypothetical protein